ncbi:MAG: DUF4160 domain-containing protein [Candidatus Hydrogenedens sp.]|nr:DUF4160 domain-containing protein [Candidatus Hydrogenedens sp.]
MPTILLVSGWRFFFYSNEGNEPPHIHCRKGGAEAKYWLYREAFDIAEAYAHGLTPSDTRAVRKIIFEHFDYLLREWDIFQERKDG